MFWELYVVLLRMLSGLILKVILMLEFVVVLMVEVYVMLISGGMELFM